MWKGWMNMQEVQLRLLVIGAHPDDCDILAGGTAMKYARNGHVVKFVSATNGDTGHYEKGGGLLALIRAQEAANAAKIAGIEYEVLDIHNNGIENNIQTRERMISLIREFKPEIIFTHRPYDYHPDHRITSMLVQDSSYALIIPNVCPLTSPLKRMPVIMYLSDTFKKPYEFVPDVVVDIDDVFEDKVRMLDCYKSQMYEWLPWTNGELDKVPAGDMERIKWLRERQLKRDGITAERFRQQLIQKYGDERGRNIKAAEAFELCEYGTMPEKEELQKMFPF
jgi:LmbE family N-acetylglucosaminyl deacetylase